MMSDLIQSVRNFNQIKRKQFDPPGKLKAYQLESLKETLWFVCTKVPYYIEAYGKAGIRWDDIRTWDDFQRIPFLTKQELRSRPPEDFIATDIDRKTIWKTQTTGSSGIPITVFRNGQSTAWDRALVHYCFHTLGIRAYHRFCQLVAFLSEKPHPRGPLDRLGFKRNFLVNLRDTDEEIVRRIQAIEPDALCTFPSVFLRLAEYLKPRKIKLGVRWLIAQGEVLPEPWRATIEKAFGAPLYHTYGTTEIARVGFECRKQRGYHLIADGGVVEIWNGGRPAAIGEEGEIVLTNLNNFCSPLVRYRIGDRGALSAEPCFCGLTYPMLTHVTGRSDDFVMLPSGRKVSARNITHMQFDGIIQYKIIQRSPAKLEMLVIPAESFGEGTLREIKEVLMDAFLGERIGVEIKVVESLPVSRTGKLQLVTREFSLPGEAATETI